MDRLREGGLRGWHGRCTRRLVRSDCTVPASTGDSDPHTAIIKRKKDQVGHQLSEFVGENFFNAPAITEQLRKAKIPKLISDQLLTGNNAERASEQICHVVDRAVNDIDPAMAEQVLRALVVDKLNEPMCHLWDGDSNSSLKRDAPNQSWTRSWCGWTIKHALVKTSWCV